MKIKPARFISVLVLSTLFFVTILSLVGIERGATSNWIEPRACEIFNKKHNQKYNGANCAATDEQFLELGIHFFSFL